MPRTCDLITALGALFLLAFDDVLYGADVAEGVLGEINKYAAGKNHRGEFLETYTALVLLCCGGRGLLWMFEGVAF